jgi:hypothetical protein
LELLRLDACGQYSPLWLHSEPKTLNKLMYFDPQGFFIFNFRSITHIKTFVKYYFNIYYYFYSLYIGLLELDLPYITFHISYHLSFHISFLHYITDYTSKRPAHVES